MHGPKSEQVSVKVTFFPLEKAIFQGETLSPKLFTIYIEDLVGKMYNSNLSALKVGNIDIHILLYADDIILLASNPIHLQEKIDVMVEYFRENNIIINLDKSKIVIFRYGNRKIRRLKCFWINEEIEIVDKYTYLGVTFYGNMDYGQTCTNFFNKAESAEKQLFSVFYKGKIKTADSRLSLFDTLVKSTLMYCSSIWGIKYVVDRRLNLGKMINFIP